MLKVKFAETYEECEILCQEILGSKKVLIGLDTETTVIYDERKLRPVSILQLCIEGDYGGTDIKKINEYYTAYIICLAKIWNDFYSFPISLINILSSKALIKTGCDIKTDYRLLYESYDLECCTSIDIQYIAITMDIPNISMDYLSSIFLEERKNKEKRIGIWHENLSREQIVYAAQDAYLSIKLYQVMIKGIKIPKKEDVNNICGVVEEFSEYVVVLNKARKNVPSTGIKKDSLINFIANSNWTNLSALEKKKKAGHVVREGVENNIFIKFGDKLVYV